jgi:uncharacterized membrane protein
MGLILLWRNAHKAHLWWSGKMLAGTMLMGFGAFNVVEGFVDHQLLGIHHVNETSGRRRSNGSIGMGGSLSGVLPCW